MNHSAAKKHRRTKKGELISVVIPTRNAASTLDACMRSVVSQSHPKIEVIIADNYSVDKTREIGKEYGAKVILCGPPPPLNNFFTAPIQRSLGATHAFGDFLFFVDADMVLERELIEECVEKCFGGADAIGIPEISFGEGFWSRCKTSERSCYFDRLFSDQNIQASRFIRRSVYESIGGWDKDVGFLDDWDITTRLRASGFRISRSDHHILHNEGRQTLRRITLKKYNFGKSADLSRYLSSGGKTFRMTLEQLTPFRIFTLLRRLPKINKNITEIVGVALMKTVEGLAFIAGLTVSKS